MAQSLANLLVSAGDRLNDPNHVTATLPQLRRWINEATREIARRTECLFGTDTIPVLAGTQSYFLPPDVVRLNHVQYELDTQTIALEYIEQGAAQYLWGVNQAHQSAWPEQYTTWGHPGSSTFSIRLFPVPSSNGTLRIYYSRLPVELATDGSDDNTSIDVPNGWEDPLLDYVQAQVFLRDRRADDYQLVTQRFQDRLVALVETSGRDYNTNPGMITPLMGIDTWGVY